MKQSRQKQGAALNNDPKKPAGLTAKELTAAEAEKFGLDPAQNWTFYY